MKKTLSILILLIAFCELKAQNKQLEFNVEKPDVGVDIIIDENLVVGWKYELKLITKYKNKKYRFTFTHGTIEQKNQVLLLNPDKTGEGTIKVYELIEKKYKLVKEVVVDVFERPMYCFGEICFSNNDEIKDLNILIHPFTVKFINNTKELVYEVYKSKLIWFCNEVLYERKIAGNHIDKKYLNSVDNSGKICNPLKLYFEDVYYKKENGKLAKAFYLDLNYSNPDTELK